MKSLDIVVMTDTAPLSKVIQFFIGKWSHVFIVYSDVAGTIVHADGGKVRKEPLKFLLSKSPDYELVVLRIKEGYKFNSKQAYSYINSQLGEEYGVMNAIGRGFYRFLSWLGVNRKARSVFYNDNQLICSVFGGGMPADQGIKVRPDVHWTQLEPEDLLASDVFTVIEVVNEGAKLK